MKDNIPKLNKKTLTKLINPDFRKSILKLNKNDRYGISAYARYVCDSQILQRMQGHENDASAGWGFPQLNILCCVRKDGTVDKKFFEFNSVNHFLKDHDGDSAVEVIECILTLWLKAEKDTIESFDYERIDAELVKLDKELKEKQEKDAKIEQIGNLIKNVVKPIVDEAKNKEYDRESIIRRTDEALQQFVNSKQIAKFTISTSRNSDKTIEAGWFFIDIRYKLEENDEYTVLVCSVTNRKEETKAQLSAEQENSNDIQ